MNSLRDLVNDWRSKADEMDSSVARFHDPIQADRTVIRQARIMRMCAEQLEAALDA